MVNPHLVWAGFSGMLTIYTASYITGTYFRSYLKPYFFTGFLTIEISVFIVGSIVWLFYKAGVFIGRDVLDLENWDDLWEED